MAFRKARHIPILEIMPPEATEDSIPYQKPSSEFSTGSKPGKGQTKQLNHAAFPETSGTDT